MIETFFLEFHRLVHVLQSWKRKEFCQDFRISSSGFFFFPKSSHLKLVCTVFLSFCCQVHRFPIWQQKLQWAHQNNNIFFKSCNYGLESLFLFQNMYLHDYCNHRFTKLFLHYIGIYKPIQYIQLENSIAIWIFGAVVVQYCNAIFFCIGPFSSICHTFMFNAQCDEIIEIVQKKIFFKN